MVRVNVHEAKTNLSKLLEQVEKGEVVVLCRRNVPIAEIRAVAKEPEKKPRELGWGKGEIVIHPSFYEPMSEEELEEWYKPL